MVTTAEIRVMRTILSSGGLWERHIHNGRRRTGTANRNTVYRLVKAGLVECVDIEAPHRQKYRALGGVTTDLCYFVSAAGCLAVHDDDVRRALAQEQA